MITRITLFLSGFLWLTTSFAQTGSFSKAIDQLNTELARVPAYDRHHQAGIASLKETLSNADTADLAGLFRINENLYNKYRVFQYDSAYHYANRMRDIAGKLNDPALINLSRIKLGFSLLSSGMYKETFDLLAGMNGRQVPDSNKAEYYALMGRYYYDLGDFDNDKYHTPFHVQQGNLYMDSVLAVLPANSNDYLYYKGLKALKTGQGEIAKANFNQILSRRGLSSHEVAVVASTLSDFHIKLGEIDAAIPLLVKSVIADIQSSTKETTAAFTLATIII